MSAKFWTDEKIDELKAMAADPRQFTAEVIGSKLGISRNAALGKLFRLALTLRGRPLLPRAVVERNVVRKAKLRPANNPPRTAEQAEQAEPATQPAPQFCGSLNIPFADLRNRRADAANQCRYITGDAPEYLCCGIETLPGASWCGHHHGIVLKSPEQHRQDRKKWLESRPRFAARAMAEAWS